MTDPVRALEAVLRGIEERTPRDCDGNCEGDGSRHSWDCDVRQVARVRAEQARAVERMVEAAIRATSDDVSLPDVWAAALRAGEEPRT